MNAIKLALAISVLFGTLGATPVAQGQCFSWPWWFESVPAWCFHSQRGLPWGPTPLGWCGPSVTHANTGCLVADSAMAATRKNFAWYTPGVVDDYLSSYGDGYSNGCALGWNRFLQIDGSGGLTGVQFPSLPSSPATLRSWLLSGKFVIVRSTRFAPQPHWVVVAGFLNYGTSLNAFYYRDPYDLCATGWWLNPGASGSYIAWGAEVRLVW